MSLFWLPSPRTCDGSPRWSLGLHPPGPCASRKRQSCVETVRVGRSKPAVLNEMADDPSASADFCNKIGTKRTFRGGLTMSALGVERTSRFRAATSESDPKRTAQASGFWHSYDMLCLS